MTRGDPHETQIVSAYEAHLRAGGTDAPAAFLKEHAPEATHLAERLEVVRALHQTARGSNHLGPYELEAEIGRGAQGVVYRARDTRLGRHVALKLLHTTAVDDPTSLMRFQREAEAASRIDHPHVATVYEAGVHDGKPFIAMQYVEGPSLAHVLSEQGTLTTESRDQRLGYIESIADGLAAAHEAGLIHRDIKPGNVLLDDDDRPVIVDFGLARTNAVGDPGLTHTGDLRGTPSYMAPEQITGRSKLDARTDVYALGVVAYELVSGSRPFDGTTWDALFRQVLHEEPVRPANCSKDLWVVLQTAMAKDPKARYGTARDFAEDVRRVRKHEPIRARPLGPLGRATRWARRRPALAVALLLVIGSAVSVAVQQGLAAERLASEVDATRHERDRADRRAYLANVRAADISLAMHDAAEARRQLDACPPALRGWEWRYLQAGLDESVTQAKIHPGSTVGIATSSDGAWLAAVGSHGTLRVASTAPDPEAPPTVVTYETELTCVAIAPDDQRIATGAANRSVQLWRPDGTLERTLSFHANTLHAVAFSADGRYLLSGCRGGALAIYDLQANRLAHFIEGMGASVRAIVADPRTSGAWIGTGIGRVAYVALASGALREVTNVGTQIWHMDLDGESLLLGLSDATARRVDARTGEERMAYRGHRRRVTGVAFAGDDEVITASLDGSIRVWDRETGRPLQALVGHAGSVRTLHWLARDGTILTGGDDGTLRTWFHGAAASRALSGDGEPVPRAISVHPAGRVVAVGGHRGGIFLHDAWTGDLQRIVWESGNTIRALKFTADGKHLVTGAVDGMLRIYDATLASPPREIPTGGAVYDLALHPDGRHVMTAGSEGCVRLWDLASGALQAVHASGDTPIQAIALGTEGRRLVVARRDGTALHDLTRKERLWTLPQGGRDVALSPDGTLVAVANKVAVTLHDAADGREKHRCVGSDMFVTSIDFHPDGTRLASTGFDQTVRLWDTRDGSSVSVLRESTSWVRVVAWSPRGDTLLAGASDQTLRMWRTTRPEGFFAHLRARRKALAEAEPMVDRLYEDDAWSEDVVAAVRSRSDLRASVRAAAEHLAQQSRHRHGRSTLRAALDDALEEREPSAPEAERIARMARRYAGVARDRWSSQGTLALAALRSGQPEAGLARLRRYAHGLARAGRTRWDARLELVRARILIALDEPEAARARMTAVEHRLAADGDERPGRHRALLDEVQRLLGDDAPK